MMSYLYLVTVFALLVIFVLGLILMRFFTNKLLTNIIFCLITFICYLFVILIAYINNGPYDWNFTNTLPVANVSPFMFFTCPLFFALPIKIRKYHATLISLLVVGMILSPIFSCIYNFSISYKYHPSFLLDYISHISLALWGIYLYQSKQCELKIKESLIGGSIIVVVALIVMILNVIFDQSFFGLSLNGKHTIYNMKLVDNSYLSALIYFSGLVGVLVLGYFFEKIILKIIEKGPRNQ